MELSQRRNRVDVKNIHIFKMMVASLVQQSQQSQIRPANSGSDFFRKNKNQKVQQSKKLQKFQQIKILKKLFSSSAGFSQAKNSSQRGKSQVSKRLVAKMNIWQGSNSEKRARTSENKRLLNSQNKFYKTDNFKSIDKFTATYGEQKQNLFSKTFTVASKTEDVKILNSIKEDIEEMDNFKADFTPFMDISNFYLKKQALEKKRAQQKLQKYNRKKFETVWSNQNFSRLFKQSNLKGTKQKLEKFNQLSETK